MAPTAVKKISPLRAKDGALAPNPVNYVQNRTINGPKGSKHELKSAISGIFGPKNISFGEKSCGFFCPQTSSLQACHLLAF